MIYTFYSYKGGVGRSMALANIAKWLAMQGLNVAMIDWDLEAPGLENFFYASPEDAKQMRSELGIIDLLTAYKAQSRTLDLSAEEAGLDDFVGALEAQLPPLSSVLVPIETGDPSAASLWLIPAGWRSGDRFADYAQAVQGFDWRGFYSDYHGEAYFEWLRRQLLAPGVADVVLIDSRTGVTEMGGVCTRQLADVVVSFCVPNVQNLDGVAGMAASFKRTDLAKARGRDLEVVIVPTRIDQSEIDRRNAFERLFRQAMDGFTPIAFRKFNRQFWDLKIPYISKYAYQEALAIGATDAAEELTTAYQGLAAHLALLGPEDNKGLARLWDAFWSSVSAPPSVSLAPTLLHLPRPNNSYFTGREELLGEIRHRLKEGPVALHGLPGAGKSELALEYAYRNGDDYDVVWWVRCGDRTSLEADLGALAASMSLAVTDESGSAAARQWLERNERWLVILDDADGPADLADYVPRTIRGHVLITSRNPNWGRFAGPLHVGTFARAEAVEFLRKRIGQRDGNEDELAAALGDLPLALEMAASYIQTTAQGQPLREYLTLFTHDETRLLLLRRTTDTVEQSLGVLLDSLLFALETEAPAAAGLLTVCSFLDSAPVPIDLIVAGSESLAPDELPRVLTMAFGDRLALNDVVATIRRYSLVEPAGAQFELHPLVQVFVRGRLDPAMAPGWAAGALRLATAALLLAGESKPPSAVPELVSHVYVAAGHVLRLEGSLDLVSNAMRVAVDTALRVGGERDPVFALALRGYGLTLARLGDAEGAERALSQALVIDLKSFGVDDPRVGAGLTNVAGLLLEIGRTEDARGLVEHILAMSEDSLGEKHPATQAIRTELSAFQRSASR